MVHGDSIMKFLQNDNDTMAYFNKILSLNFLIFFLFPVNYPTDGDKLICYFTVEDQKGIVCIGSE